MAAIITSYIDPNGVKRRGYIIDGSTYEDQAGTVPVEKGSLVSAGGKTWVKGVGEAGESMLYADYLKRLGSGSQDSGQTQIYSSLIEELEAGAKADYEAAKTQGESLYAREKEKAEAERLRREQETGEEYDSLSTGLYRDYMQRKKTLPQLLSAQGLSGGAAESSLLGLEADYQREQAENRRSMLNALAEIRSEGDETLAGLLEDKTERDTVAEKDYREALSRIEKLREQEREQAEEKLIESEKKLREQLLEKAELLAAAGDFSGYRALGFSEEEIAALEKAYNEKNFSTRLKIAQQKARYGDNSMLLELLKE